MHFDDCNVQCSIMRKLVASCFAARCLFRHCVYETRTCTALLSSVNLSLSPRWKMSTAATLHATTIIFAISLSCSALTWARKWCSSPQMVQGWGTCVVGLCRASTLLLTLDQVCLPKSHTNPVFTLNEIPFYGIFVDY